MNSFGHIVDLVYIRELKVRVLISIVVIFDSTSVQIIVSLFEYSTQLHDWGLTIILLLSSAHYCFNSRLIGTILLSCGW